MKITTNSLIIYKDLSTVILLSRNTNMIAVNELRIGNYISEKVLGICPVIEISNKLWVKVEKENLEYTLICNNIEPVLLTPEILESCGFEYQGWTFRKGSFHLSYDDEVFKMIRVEPKIKHLHQLQNLYFVFTGEEIEIKITSDPAFL